MKFNEHEYRSSIEITYEEIEERRTCVDSTYILFKKRILDSNHVRDENKHLAVVPRFFEVTHIYISPAWHQCIYLSKHVQSLDITSLKFNPFYQDHSLS